MNESREPPTKISKACDECKARKVRCVMTTVVPTVIPSHSANHSENLNIDQSYAYDIHPSAPPIVTATTTSTATNNQQWPNEHPKKLFVDILLENREICDRSRSESSILKAHDQYSMLIYPIKSIEFWDAKEYLVGSSGIAFFSKRRIASISNRLGHTKLEKTMETLTTGLSSRMNASSYPFATAQRHKTPSALSQISEESTKSYVSAYFSHIHPVYPFLVQQSFEDKAFHPDLSQFLEDSLPFSTLYHTILALGCQYRGGGSFEPKSGTAWKLYEVALGSLSEILVLKESLLSVQAIFAQDSSCVQIGNMLTAEVARMAQSIGINKAVYQGQNELECQRTFWVVYILEKLMSFACSRTSALSDCDIGTPIIEIPEAIFSGFDWFYSMARFSRLISKAYDTLFSITATLAAADETQAAINTFNIELEHWRSSIPEDFRPGNSLDALKFPDGNLMAVILRVHYHYYSVVIALSRLGLNVQREETSHSVESKKALLNAARVIVELTRYIDIEAYTPIWILGSMPLTALFILFDFIVYNPTHSETRRNLSLLGAGAGYFCRIEFASDGALQTSLLLDLAHIARDYVQGVESNVSIETRVPGDEDSYSALPSLISANAESRPLSVSGSALVDQTLENSSLGTDNLCYPIDGVLLPIGDMFSESYDLGDFLPDYTQATAGLFGGNDLRNGYP
ncbi:hypothetical protein V491_08377 [Pseudogymnoascus sp. VKM F-3775]|nr:hypothetical protein V491_08377 [Pseudogymnoascus sp. VKM F-3775]